MERESKVGMESSSSYDFGLDVRNKYTLSIKKKSTEDMLRKKRMRIINFEGDIEKEMKHERETFNRFENYLKLISSLNDGEPEITDDRSLSMNSSNVETAREILEEFGSPAFTQQVVNLGAHKALNFYIQAYTMNRNNSDLATYCTAVLTILEICTRDDKKLIYALERDIKYLDTLITILKGEIRSLGLLYKVLDCLANLINFDHHREKFFKEGVMMLIKQHLQQTFEKPTGTAEDIEEMVTLGMWCIAKLVPTKEELVNHDREPDFTIAGAIAAEYFRLNMHDPLIWIYDILAKFYAYFEIEHLMNDELLPPDLIEYSFKLFMDKDTKVKLKTKILDTLTSLLSVDFMEQHLDFANKDFYVCLKYDFLNEHIEQSKLSLHKEFFCSIAAFLTALFEFNDNETNVSICEDLEFEKLFLEFLVNNKQKPTLLFYIYKLILSTVKYTNFENVRRLMMDKDDLQVFHILFDSIKDLPTDEQEVTQGGLECVQAILELETFETSHIQKRTMREKVLQDKDFMNFLGTHADDDDLLTLQLKEKIVERLDIPKDTS